jgi:Tfp pilus assembly major pilin PilA
VLVLIAVWILPVLFVGGIVAAIALPAYQDYVKRAQAKQFQQK